MPRALVKGEYTATGEPVYRDVPLAELQANPGRYEVAGDVRATLAGELVSVAPTEGLKLAEGTAYQQATGAQVEEAAQLAGAEATQGGLVGGAKAFGEGFASGGTFGLYDQWRNAVGGEAEKIARRERALVQSEARLGGEILSAVAPVVLSGGTGLAGAVARGTPVGLVERGAARVAALGAGRGTAGRVGGKLAGAAIEGAADSAGQYMAQQALRDEPLSAEGLAASMGTGALFGAGGSAVLQGMSQLNRAAGRVATKLGDDTSQLGKLGSPQIGDAGQLAGAAKEAAKVRGQFARLSKEIGRETIGETGERIPLADIVRVQKTPGAVKTQAVRTLRAIDQADAVLLRADEALQGLDMQALRALRPDLADQLDDVLMTRRAAQQAAQEWGQEFAASAQKLVDAPRAAKKVAAETITDELDTRGVRVLGALDDSQAALDDVLEQVQEAAGAAVAQPSKARGFYGRLMSTADKVSDLAGAVEVAQSLGAPVPDLDSIPIIGPVLSTYAKARFLAGKLGVADTKGTPLASKARFVADLGRRIEDFGTRLSLGKVVARAGTRLLRPEQIATLSTNLQDTPEEQVAAALDAEIKGVPADVAEPAKQAAAAKIQYLRENLPKPPSAFAKFGADTWRPTPSETMRANALLRAADDPLAAVEAVMAGHEFLSPVVRKTIKAVYPQLWASLQAQVADNATELYRRRPLAEVVEIGRFFEVPTAPQLTPQYRRATQSPQAPTAPPEIQAPPPSAISAQAASLDRTLGRELPR